MQMHDAPLRIYPYLISPIYSMSMVFPLPMLAAKTCNSEESVPPPPPFDFYNEFDFGGH